MIMLDRNRAWQCLIVMAMFDIIGKKDGNLAMFDSNVKNYKMGAWQCLIVLAIRWEPGNV